MAGKIEGPTEDKYDDISHKSDYISDQSEWEEGCRARFRDREFIKAKMRTTVNPHWRTVRAEALRIESVPEQMQVPAQVQVPSQAQVSIQVKVPAEGQEEQTRPSRPSCPTDDKSDDMSDKSDDISDNWEEERQARLRDQEFIENWRKKAEALKIESEVSVAAAPTTSSAVGVTRSSAASSASGMARQMTPDTAKLKCRNFLATLLRLADEQSASMAQNVRTLIQGLVDGAVDPEVFTRKLQLELNAAPQPGLVPFLKLSLPYLQTSLRSGELSIEGVRAPSIYRAEI